jgi:lysyl-tRNA synthetase class 2
MDDLNQVLRVRREKLDALRARGIEPFAYGFERSHRAADTVSCFESAEGDGRLGEDGEGEPVRTAGRIVGWRGHGKSAFAHLEDASGRVQVYFRRDLLGAEAFETLDLLDLGDWLGVEGPTFRTRTGEVSVRVRSWTLLAKSLRPLPFGKVETHPETAHRPLRLR